MLLIILDLSRCQYPESYLIYTYKNGFRNLLPIQKVNYILVFSKISLLKTIYQSLIQNIIYPSSSSEPVTINYRRDGSMGKCPIRWKKMPCTKIDIGDECHYLFCCEFFEPERKRVLKRNFYTRPNMLKFKTFTLLWQYSNIKEAFRICQTDYEQVYILLAL